MCLVGALGEAEMLTSIPIFMLSWEYLHWLHSGALGAGDDIVLTTECHQPVCVMLVVWVMMYSVAPGTVCYHCLACLSKLILLLGYAGPTVTCVD